MKKNGYHTVLVTIMSSVLLLLAQNIFSQPPSVKTSVDKNTILIGAQLHYRVSTSMPDNTYRLSWFNMTDTLGNFQVVKENKIDSITANGNLNFSQDIIITSFDSGRQVIPPLVLNIETLDGDSSFNLVTDSIPVNVSFAPMDSVKTFHDIKSIIEVKKQWPWWWWALLGIALILLIFWIRFLIIFLKKKKATPDFFKAKLSPYDEAMKALDDLQAEHLLQNNEPNNYQVKEYHTRLTGIIKRFISRRTKVYKMNLTSDEMLIDINEYGIGKQQLSAFANCLRMNDAVKFAKYIPPKSESEKCLEETKEVITEINKNLNKKPESDI